jgi:hypothetical protein
MDPKPADVPTEADGGALDRDGTSASTAAAERAGS